MDKEQWGAFEETVMGLIDELESDACMCEPMYGFSCNVHKKGTVSKEAVMSLRYECVQDKENEKVV